MECTQVPLASLLVCAAGRAKAVALLQLIYVSKESLSASVLVC